MRRRSDSGGGGVERRLGWDGWRVRGLRRGASDGDGTTVTWLQWHELRERSVATGAVGVSDEAGQ